MSLFANESFFVLPLKYSDDEMLTLRKMIKEHGQPHRFIRKAEIAGGRIVEGLLNATIALTKVASEHRVMRHLDSSIVLLGAS